MKPWAFYQFSNLSQTRLITSQSGSLELSPAKLIDYRFILSLQRFKKWYPCFSC